MHSRNAISRWQFIGALHTSGGGCSLSGEGALTFGRGCSLSGEEALTFGRTGAHLWEKKCSLSGEENAGFLNEKEHLRLPYK